MKLRSLTYKQELPGSGSLKSVSAVGTSKLASINSKVRVRFHAPLASR